MANLGRGPSYVCWDSNFRTLHDRPQFTQIPKTTETNSRRNIPGAPRSILGAANALPGYERCRCRGFKTGCGLVRSSRTRLDHSNKEKELRTSNYDKIRHDICEQWLTLQFIEIHRHLLANSLGDLVDKFDVQEHWNAPKEPQDEEVPEHNVDLGVGNGAT